MKKLLCVAFLTLMTLNLMAPTITGSQSLILRQSAMKLIMQQKEKLFYGTFSPSLFYEALLSLSIQQPEIVFRQAILETGWFTSESFLIGNNPFGMKQPTHRESLCVGTYLGHGKYDHWYDAIKDYKLWQDYWIKGIYTEDEYYNFLDTSPYAMSRRYTATLKLINLNDLIDIPTS